MHYQRVHIEVTNICGLECTFCPPKSQPVKTMSLDFFETVIVQLRAFTKSLAFHVMGDPLTLSNLENYLELAYKYGFEVELTTSGYYLPKTSPQVLFHKAVRQLNISLNSYNKNTSKLTFDEYMDGILLACGNKLQSYPRPFINLRLWNLDEVVSEMEFNQAVFEKLEQFFDLRLDTELIYTQKVKSIRLASKILLNFDSYFEWPSLENTHRSEGFCYGLKSHIAILADGTVVPCCLDGNGVINLGNLHNTLLVDILHTRRVVDMIDGFSHAKAVEELCLKCSYKERFKI